MKTSLPLSKCKRRERGMATIVIMALLALVLILVTANVRGLSTLGRELKLIDQKQKEHWKALNLPNTFRIQAPSNSTNTPATTPVIQPGH